MSIHLSFRKSGRLHTNGCYGKMGIGRAILADRSVPHALSHVWRRQRKRICDLKKAIIIIKDTYTNEFASVLDYKKNSCHKAGVAYSFCFCGRRGIRTPGTLTSTSVQQTGGFSHSPILPNLSFAKEQCKSRQKKQICKISRSYFFRNCCNNF